MVQGQGPWTLLSHPHLQGGSAILTTPKSLPGPLPAPRSSICVCRCLLTQPFSGCAHTHPHLLLHQPHETCLMVACIIGLAGPSEAFQAGTSGKEPTCQCRRCKRHRFNPWFRKIPWRRAWQPTPVFLPIESLGQRSLSGYSPQDRKEPDTTEVTKHAHMVAITKSHRRGSLTTDMYYLAVLEARSLRSGVFRAVSV